MELLHHEIIRQAAKPDAEWIVCIHGAGGNSQTWKYQTEQFKPHFKLLLLDLRDHGESKKIEPQYDRYTFELIASDILKVIDVLKINQAYFMSLSLGSMVLQKLALMRTGLLKGAVLAGGVFHVNSYIMAFANTANFLTRFLPYRWMYLLFSFLVMPRKNHAHSRKIFIKQSALLTSSEYNRWITLYQDFRKVLSDYYHKPLTYPLLVVMGGEDYIFLKAAKRYAANQSLCELEVLSNCGHICNIEKPEQFNGLALDFLKKINRKPE